MNSFFLLLAFILIIYPICPKSEKVAKLEDLNLQDYFSKSITLNKDFQFDIYWKTYQRLPFNQSIFEVILRGSNVHGWMGIGFGKNLAMLGSDYFICYQNESTMIGEDRFNDLPYITPSLDTDIGGSDDILFFEGIRNSSFSICRFQRYLNTQDSRDVSIPLIGQVHMLIAFNAELDLFNSHTNYDSFDIEVTPTVTINSDTTEYLGLEVDYTKYMRHCVIGGDLCMFWKIEQDLIDVIINANTKGYAGMGFSAKAESPVSLADMILCCEMADEQGSPNKGQMRLLDAFSTSATTPPEDISLGGTNDILRWNISRNLILPFLSFRFQRNLRTGDKHDLEIKDETMNVIFAMNRNTADARFAHAASDSALVHINLFTGKVCQDPLRTLHGVVMIVGWAFFVVIGIFISVFVPKSYAWWFYAHVIFNSLGFVLQIVGFAVAFCMSHSAKEIGKTHKIFGIAVMILSTIQVLLGILADQIWRRSFKATGGKIPSLSFHDLNHHWVGRLVFLIAIINLFFGLREFNAPNYAYIILSCWLLFVALAFVVLDFHKSLRNKDTKPH